MIIQGDARAIPLADGVVQCCVTSSPYWGLRSYGTPPRVWGGDPLCLHDWQASAPRRPRGENDAPNSPKQLTSAGTQYNASGGLFCGFCGAWKGELGLEPSPDLFVQHIVEVCREIRRVLRDDGTFWYNIGDSYISAKGSCFNPGGGESSLEGHAKLKDAQAYKLKRPNVSDAREWGLKHKDLAMIPARVALALQADGWYLRSDIIWAKPNPMPESVTDRPTRSHEYIFLLSKSERYFYDQDAIREPHLESSIERAKHGWNGNGSRDYPGQPQLRNRGEAMDTCHPNGRNKRSVWTVNSGPTPEAHFATFPQKLIEPCILAGTSEKGCCAECGAPRVRVVEKEGYPDPASTADDQGRMKASGDVATDTQRRKVLSGSRHAAWKREHPDVVKGWRPSCSHDAPSVPCLVLDPFIGSGTVGKVCERFGRRWVGLELSPSYIEIARKRTAQMGLQI